MLELNEQQLLFVSERLTNMGLEYEPLYDELLDHISCTIEIKMIDGQNFHQACNTVFNAFGKEGIKELQKQIIYSHNQNSNRMKKLSLVFVTMFFFIGPLFWLGLFSDKEIIDTDRFTISSIDDDPPSLKPLGDGYEVTSAFGSRFHPIFKKKKMHKGVDFKAPIGTPVYATSNGTIVKVRLDNKGYGKHIVIQHDDVYQTMYAQLSEINVEEGEIVKKGQQIGKVGSSGTSTGPHLHYEVIKLGVPVNPIAYFNP